MALAQLTVLAAATVIAAYRFFLRVAFRLTSDTQAHTGNRLAPGFWYGFAAFGTVTQASAMRQSVTRAPDGILDRCIDLILYRAVFCEATSHSGEC
jgi:hypothetical protein